MTTAKTLYSTDPTSAAANTPDIQVWGGDVWKLISKASSTSEGWMKTTKAMQAGDDVIVQTETQQRCCDFVSRIATFVTEPLPDYENGQIVGTLLRREFDEKNEKRIDTVKQYGNSWVLSQSSVTIPNATIVEELGNPPTLTSPAPVIGRSIRSTTVTSSLDDNLAEAVNLGFDAAEAAFETLVDLLPKTPEVQGFLKKFVDAIGAKAPEAK
jgi:hypothetical protein